MRKSFQTLPCGTLLHYSAGRSVLMQTGCTAVRQRSPSKRRETSHPFEWRVPTRSGGYPSLVRVGTPDPSDARGSIRAEGSIPSAQRERFHSVERLPFTCPSGNSSPVRVGTPDPSETRDSFRVRYIPAPRVPPSCKFAGRQSTDFTQWQNRSGRVKPAQSFKCHFTRPPRYGST